MLTITPVMIATSQHSETSQPYLWHSDGTYIPTILRQFSEARDDVKLGKHNLMRLIFIIRARYMSANINLALVTADEDSQQYTSFGPMLDHMSPT